MNPRAFFALPVLLSGCAAPSPPLAPSPAPMSMTISSGKDSDYAAIDKRAEEAAPLIGAQNDFGARVISRLEKENIKHDNLLASPTSLWQALALAAGGARGQTKAQMGGLLSLQSLPDDKIGPANRAFNALLAEQKGASISVANSLWFADSFAPNPTFVQNAAQDFGAGVEKFSTADLEGGASRINSWVSDHTKKEI